MVVQALGILSAFAVLTQIRIAGLMPRLAYAAIATAVGLQVRGGPVGSLSTAGRCDALHRVYSRCLQLIGKQSFA